MGIKKNLYFDNVNLADYGVYITGEAVYNAPERDVEIITIPARNGDYVIDNGRFNNITVTYPAGIFDYDAETFASRISEIRNFLASKKGYKKITDDYNPNEFRYGFYVGGFEVSPVANNTAGEFEISFNCKPQRFLTSGNTKTTVSSGGTITNPTLFDSKPLFEVNGYGSLYINDHPITITGGAMGAIVLSDSISGSGFGKTINYNWRIMNIGDTLTLEASQGTISLEFNKIVSNATTTSTSGTLSVTESYSNYGVSTLLATFDIAEITTTHNSSYTTTSKTVNTTVTFNDNTTTTVTYKVQVTQANGYFKISFSYNTSATLYNKSCSYTIGRLIGVSSQSVLGNPIYIDCEEIIAYKIENDSYISLNQYVTIPDPVPVLTSGENEIVFDNTITNFKIVPRWWII